jgi:hypothetical protein
MMLEQPDIRPTLTRSGWAYRLNSPYFYEWEKDGIRRRLRIAAGFEYDGASVPRPLWTLTGIERDGLQRAAALVHDVFYRSGGSLGEWIAQEVWSEGRQEWESEMDARWTRAQVDALFCRMLREAGVSMLKRRVMYRGVRGFGWLFWGGKEPRS